MKKTHLLSTGSLDSVMAMVMFLSLTTTSAVSASPVLSDLMRDRENEIVLDTVSLNYHFAKSIEADKENYPAWFYDETEAVYFFGAGRRGHGKFKVYDYRFAQEDLRQKKPRSATRMVWDEYKHRLDNNPALYSLYEEVVDWVDETNSRSSEINQTGKEMLYSILAPVALEEAAYKRVKIHTNHIHVLSYLPRYLPKQARFMHKQRTAAAKVVVLKKSLENVVSSFAQYLSHGFQKLADKEADWELLFDHMETIELNPLIDLVVVRDSPLPIGTLRYRFNQRYLEQSLKKHYILLATFEASQNLRIHKQFPQSFADFDLSSLRNSFMKRYGISKDYTYLEDHGNSLSLNAVSSYESILDEVVEYCKDRFRMKIPAEQVMSFLDIVNNMAGFIAENAKDPAVTEVFLNDMAKLLKKNYYAELMGAAQEKV